MRSWKKVAALACAFLLVISGCSQNDSDKKVEGNANATDTNPPKNDAANTVNESMDHMMNYMKENGVTLNDIKELADMDFAAHEGRSFSYEGNTAYLYRLKDSDESMKALLDSAKNTGKVKVNINGEQKDYAAAVNGNYLLIYLQEAKMDDFLKYFDSYKAGIGGIDSSDNSGSATGKDTVGNDGNSSNNTTTPNMDNGAQNANQQNNTAEEPID